MTERNEQLDDFLDEGYPVIEIAGITITPSRALYECDPIAYRCLAADWEDEDEDVDTVTPLDVWLKFESPEDDEASHEANTYRTETGYRIEWYLNSVGQVSTLHFSTLDEAHAWYEREGFQDFSS